MLQVRGTMTGFVQEVFVYSEIGRRAAGPGYQCRAVFTFTGSIDDILGLHAM